MTIGKSFPYQVVLLILFSFLKVSYGENVSADYSFSKYSVSEGLSQSTVFAVYQDSEGFIWIGTRGGGLNRFDGYNFDVFMHNSADSSSLSHNEVLSINEDSDNSLWIGTRGGGVNRFDRDKQCFVRYQLDSVEDVPVKSIFEDENKTLYLGTFKGLYYKSYDSDEFQLFSSGFNETLMITSVLGLSADTLLLAARSGLYKVSKKSGDFIKVFEISPDPVFGEYYQVPMLADSKGNIWFGSPLGLHVFTDSGLKTVRKNPFDVDLLRGAEIRVIYEDKNGYLWIGYSDGLIKLDPGTSEYTSFKSKANDFNSLSHNSVFSITQDKDGNFWIGTWGGGLTFMGFIPPKFQHFFYNSNGNSLSNNIVSSFAEAEDGMWIATEGGGVNHFNPSTGRFALFSDKTGKYLQSNHIKALYKDSDGMLWIGTWGEGVYRYNPVTKIIKRYLSDSKIFALGEHPAGQMWVGAIHGLHRIDFKKDTITHYTKDENSSGLKSFFITTIFKDSRGNIWVGTPDQGLYFYNKFKDEFVNFSVQPGNPNSIIDNYIISITEDSDGDLWIGTSSGICRFDSEDQLFFDMTEEIELPNRFINGLVFDHNSDLWISTNKGITRYNTQTGISRNYDVKDGLQSNEFNRGAFFKNNANEIFFGGINGFNSFNPDELQDNEIPPKVMITNFKLFNETVIPGDETNILKKRISETREIVLTHNQSNFTLEFVALNYILPEKNRYKYKLEGYSDEWVDLGNKRSISFMNLRNGKYVFRLIASNNDSVWNENGASLNITILPPPWMSDWAIAGYFILIAIMVFFFHKLISWRLTERNRIAYEKKEKERIEDLNQMKLKFFTNITHELKTPLTLITAPLDNLLNDEISREKKEYYYKLIKGNITRLKSLGNQLIDFRKAEQEYYKPAVKRGSLKEFIFNVSESFTELAEHKKINFVVDCPDKNNTDQWFDPEILEKILFNLLSNAFKFTSEGGSIRLMMKLTDNLATISVKDTGIGISPGEIPFVFDRFFTSKTPEKSNFTGTGIGLSFAKMLTEVHHGTIEVESEKGNYSEFFVTIPVDIEFYSSDELKDDTTAISFGNDSEPDENEYVYLESQTNEPSEDEELSEFAEILLLVEDNEDIAQYLINQFSDKFKVYRASNGQDGYEMARELLPNIIISDIMMDKMTGLELCKKVKSDILTTHIPVVLLTVLVTSANKMEGLEVGADAYVEKPFEIKYLRTVVYNLLKQRAAMKEKYLLENIHAAGGINSSTDSKFLGKVEEILESHYSDPDFSIVNLSEKLNVSRSQLFRKFKSVTGKSPSDFIRVVRLKKAAEIILREEIGVNEVAYKVGFNSPSYFILSFKKYFGKTPKEYAAGRS
jgi:signal transduction histidine kinase/ligand-binding sensor domain-containing protein/DNA-binding response OmpR family regulator